MASRKEKMEVCVLSSDLEQSKDPLHAGTYTAWVNYRPQLKLKAGDALDGDVPHLTRQDGSFVFMDGCRWIPRIVLKPERSDPDGIGHAMVRIYPVKPGAILKPEERRKYFGLEREARTYLEGAKGTYSLARIGKELPSGRFFVELE